MAHIELVQQAVIQRQMETKGVVDKFEEIDPSKLVLRDSILGFKKDHDSSTDKF